MEWPEFLKSSNSHEPTFDLFDASPNNYREVTAQADCWTPEEKQFFENAFAMYNNDNLDCQTFFEFVASKLPHKSMDEIKNHYLTLFQGVPMEINNPPTNTDVVVVAEDGHDQQVPQEDNHSSATLNIVPLQVENNRPRGRRGIPWTEGEHQLFLMGLNRFGKGDWKSISRYYVVSKTPTQVASHAQKYFGRRNSKTPVERRRPSINDIQTVNLTPARTTQRSTHQIHNGILANNNNYHQAAGSSSMSLMRYPNYGTFGGPSFSNNFNGNFGRFYQGEASSSNSFVMRQNNNNNNNLRRPVSPRPFLSTYLSSRE